MYAGKCLQKFESMVPSTPQSSFTPLLFIHSSDIHVLGIMLATGNVNMDKTQALSQEAHSLK